VHTSFLKPETFASAEELLARPRVVVPSCLVLDVTLPNLNGLDLQKCVVDRVDMPIIFITGYGDVPMTVRAMKVGAFNGASLSAIQDTLKRSHTALDHEAEIQTLRDCYASLSRREREVMALVLSGLLNKQVGAELGISEITVKAHRGRMIVFGEWADLICPIPAIAQRPVHKNHGRSFAHFHVMRSDAASNIDRLNDRRIGDR